MEKVPVSVVLVCHNQGISLSKNLPLILQQDYPDFEVIVVNDCSSDHSEDVLKELSLHHRNLYHTFTPSSARYVSHKKLAITIGVKAARNEWILLTDADCQPQSSEWITRMAAHFTEGADVVLGYSNYQKESGFFNSLITYDRFIENIRTFGSIGSKKTAFRGDNSNMAFRKSVFLANRGYEKNLLYSRGEETFLVNEIARKGNTLAELSPQAMMREEMPIRKRIWYFDKIYDIETRRHLKAANKLKDWFLGFCTFFTYLAFLAVVAGCVFSIVKQQWIVLAALVLLYVLFQSIRIWSLHRKEKELKESGFCWASLILGPARVFMNAALWIKWRSTSPRTFIRK